MSAEPGVVDANILVYSLFHDSAYHQACRQLLNRARADDLAICVTPQVLAEFYAVVTSPRRVSQPRSSVEALDVIAHFLTLPGVRLLPVPADIVGRLMSLLRLHPVTGSRVFDVQLVATMLGNGIRTLYTFNVSDFAAFGDIQVLQPR